MKNTKAGRMDLGQLNQLKQRLVARDDYSMVLQDFLTAFGDNSSFLKLGERIESELLTQIISEAGRQFFGGSPQLDWLFLIRIPEVNFIHGSFLLCGRVANVIYFPEISVGVLGVVISFDKPETRIIRFAASAYTDPSLN